MKILSFFDSYRETPVWTKRWWYIGVIYQCDLSWYLDVIYHADISIWYIIIYHADISWYISVIYQLDISWYIRVRTCIVSRVIYHEMSLWHIKKKAHGRVKFRVKRLFLLKKFNCSRMDPNWPSLTKQALTKVHKHQVSYMGPDLML